MTRCSGVFPSQSYLFRSAPFRIKALTIHISSLTTAICIGDPKIPPPKLTFTFALISILAASKFSSQIAKHNGVQLSLSSKLGSALPRRRPSRTPLSALTAALCKGVLSLAST